MRFRNLLIQFACCFIMLFAVSAATAQSDTTYPQNTLVMNAYTYTPVLYQQGTSTANLHIFPNPARSTANIYINSIKDWDNGEVAIFNMSGNMVYKNYIRTGNNSIDVGDLPNGMYFVKIFARDRFVYSYKMMVQK